MRRWKQAGSREAGWKRAVVFSAVLSILPLVAQSGRGASAAAQGAAKAENPAANGPMEAVRTIADPATGDCWLLEPNLRHPEGPGRLVRKGPGDPSCHWTAGELGARPTRAGKRAGMPVVRAGERIVVEEKTPVVDVRLETVAMEPGWTGMVVRVRPRTGGRVLQAMILGPGRARLVQEKGAWR